MELIDRLISEVTPRVNGAGLHLEAVEVRGSEKSRMVRVIIDTPSGPAGVSSDQLEAITRVVSDQFDELEPFGGEPYVLEVTTPGLDRPLTTPRHFERAIGRDVRVSTSEAGDVTGTVLESTDQTVTLRTLGNRTSKGGDEITIDLADISSAHHHLKW